MRTPPGNCIIYVQPLAKKHQLRAQKKTAALIQGGGQSPRGVSTNEMFVEGRHALSLRPAPTRKSFSCRSGNPRRVRPASAGIARSSWSDRRWAGGCQDNARRPHAARAAPRPRGRASSAAPYLSSTRSAANKKTGHVATAGFGKMVARGGLEPPTPAL